MVKVAWVVIAALIASGAQAAAATGAELRGRVEQGGLAVGQARPGARVSLDGQDVPVDAQGRFVVGFGRDAPAEMMLTVDGQSQTVTVAGHDWVVQRVDGLPPSTVTPDPAILARIKDDNRRIAEARARIAPVARFLDGVAWPATGPISGLFGSQRVLNGQPRAPHSGTDIAAPEGSPVRAAAAGTVSLVVPDMVLTGMTVMIDHGLGVQSVYAHMSRIDVRPGQDVALGQVIGAIGHTGRATGPHLHWGVSWQDVKLNPQSAWAALGAADQMNSALGAADPGSAQGAVGQEGVSLDRR